MIRLTEAQRRIVPLIAPARQADRAPTRDFDRDSQAHVSAIFDRLGLSNRVQIAVWYTRWEMEQEVDAKPWHEMTRDGQTERLGFSKPETGDRA